jgi:hypothetical protein
LRNEANRRRDRRQSVYQPTPPCSARKIHEAYLFEVKRPEESRYPGDFYKLRANIPAMEAFRPLKADCSSDDRLFDSGSRCCGVRGALVPSPTRVHLLERGRCPERSLARNGEAERRAAARVDELCTPETLAVGHECRPAFISLKGRVTDSDPPPLRTARGWKPRGCDATNTLDFAFLLGGGTSGNSMSAAYDRLWFSPPAPAAAGASEKYAVDQCFAAKVSALIKLRRRGSPRRIGVLLLPPQELRDVSVCRTWRGRRWWMGVERY